MKSDTFFPGHCKLDDQVSDGDKIPQLAKPRRHNSPFVKSLGLSVNNPEAIECSLQSLIRAHDADVAAHHKLQFVQVRSDKRHLTGLYGTFCIPCGNIFTVISKAE